MWRRSEYSKDLKLSCRRACAASIVVAVAYISAVGIASPQRTSDRRPPPMRQGFQHRLVLPNGMIVLLYPIAGADRVAMETFYKVGFLNEPKGVPQAAHLLEHMVCYAATASYKAHQSFELLQRKGMANAETLPAFTHFDFDIPSNDLELAIQIESERLSSLAVVPDTVREESPRCNIEAENVEKIPQAGMVKFAFCAFNQSWAHGMSEVRIRRVLGAPYLPMLESMRAQFYRPENMIVTIVGGFKPDEAVKLIHKHLASINGRRGMPSHPINWPGVKKDATVRWDSKVRAVCVAFPPPSTSRDRLILSLWGDIVNMRLSTDMNLRASSECVFVSNHLWNVGTIPFFLYATAKPGVSTAQLRKLMLDRAIQAATGKPTEFEVIQIGLLAQQIGREPDSDWKAIKQQAEAQAKQYGTDILMAPRMQLMQSALNLGFRELFMGADPSRSVRDARSVKQSDLNRKIRQYLDPSKRIVTVLEPMK